MNEDLKGLIIIICVAIGLFLTIFIIGNIIHTNLNAGKGEQIGYISEVANSGIVWRPDQIHLINSEPTYSKSQTSYSYGSDSPHVTELAKHYLKTHEKVIVTYREVMLVYAWDYHSSVIITDIKTV